MSDLSRAVAAQAMKQDEEFVFVDISRTPFEMLVIQLASELDGEELYDFYMDHHNELCDDVLEWNEDFTATPSLGDDDRSGAPKGSKASNTEPNTGW